jgi:quinolinate synthase
MSSSPIGCSLAEAAESAAYDSYLSEAGATPNSLHVVYINTSLLTKATADALVPTITCTSSNVVQTILQAFAQVRGRRERAGCGGGRAAAARAAACCPRPASVTHPRTHPLLRPTCPLPPPHPQVPDLTVWYGPDTYMGRNLAQLFTMLADADDTEIKALHPAHDRASIRALLPRLRYFDAGTCIVHHIFGGEVCELVRAGYGDAYLTAHFEVPGEMFTLAMEAKARGMGCVGSTSNILDFIAGKLKVRAREGRGGREGGGQQCLQWLAALAGGPAAGRTASATRHAFPGPWRSLAALSPLTHPHPRLPPRLQDALAAPRPDRLQFVLGTEAGMITSIVRKVQAMVKASGRDDVEVEIVFPVAPQAISTPKQAAAPGAAPLTLPGGLSVVPGPAGGEGCSLEGGCAACPYMKMNSLDALETVCGRVGSPAGEAALEGFKPRAYAQRVGGKSVAAAGCVPILHMRHFSQTKELGPALVEDIRGRHGGGTRR